MCVCARLCVYPFLNRLQGCFDWFANSNPEKQRCKIEVCESECVADVELYYESQQRPHERKCEVREDSLCFDGSSYRQTHMHTSLHDGYVLLKDIRFVKCKSASGVYSIVTRPGSSSQSGISLDSRI